MKTTKSKTPKVSELKVAVSKREEDIAKAVENYRQVAAFLRNLADQAATQPGVHPEIVKSATLVRIFLENEVAAAEKRK